MKNVIVYHQREIDDRRVDCPDGICAAWILSRAIASMGPLDSWELVGDVYLNRKTYTSLDVLPFVPQPGTKLWLVDFSYPGHILQQLADIVDRLIVLDHHIHQLDDISQVADRISGGLFPEECGATATWRHVFPHSPMPWFLKHVHRRDTGADGFYEGETMDSRAITAAMSARRKGLSGAAAFPVFEKLLEESISDLIDEGLEVLAPDDALSISLIYEWELAPVYLTIADILVPYLVIPPELGRLLSWTGTLLCKDHAPNSFVALRIEGSDSMELRSLRAGPDVGAIARQLGGGGQIHAAGFRRT